MEQSTSHAETSTLNLVSGQSGRRAPLTAQPLQFDTVAARLPAVLQATLDLDVLLELFRSQLSSLLDFASFHYHHEDRDCRIDDGSPRAHSCLFRLEIDGDSLGEIRLTRAQRFSTQEIDVLERLLCLMVYPLRNCLLYRDALAAAQRDELTGLGNRAAFDTLLAREIALSKRQHSPFSLIVMDIDNFKAINDAYGHVSGDEALRTLARHIIATLRRSDIAFRYGGEEFTLILSNTDLQAARLVAERVRIAVSQLICNDGARSFGFTISAGVAQLSGTEDANALFDRADRALYRAKQAGRNLSICAQA